MASRARSIRRFDLRRSGHRGDGTWWLTTWPFGQHGRNEDDDVRAQDAHLDAQPAEHRRRSRRGARSGAGAGRGGLEAISYDMPGYRFPNGRPVYCRLEAAPGVRGAIRRRTPTRRCFPARFRSGRHAAVSATAPAPAQSRACLRAGKAGPIGEGDQADPASATAAMRPRVCSMPSRQGLSRPRR